jgi:RNA-directed DNA polymerase
MQHARSSHQKKNSFYPLNQCALYRMDSKKRLAALIRLPLQRLVELSKNPNNYKEFPLPEEICPFTGKVKKERWVQEPKTELRTVHERLLKLLRCVSPPDYAHAAIKGRSYVSNALAHRDSHVVANFDIRKFYPSTAPSRIYNFFKEELQCSPDVATLLTNICSFKSGLPTGSPLSPILSLFANKPMFDEFKKLADLHNLKFTCYVDDVTFSGETLPIGIKFSFKAIVANHGHKVSVNKTRIYDSNDAKHITGVVIHTHVLQVPYNRFWKARAIRNAIEKSTSFPERLLLTRKLAGVLGEAAYLDKKFHPWAVKVNADMQVMSKSSVITQPSILTSTLEQTSPEVQLNSPPF